MSDASEHPHHLPHRAQTLKSAESQTGILVHLWREQPPVIGEEVLKRELRFATDVEPITDPISWHLCRPLPHRDAPADLDSRFEEDGHAGWLVARLAHREEFKQNKSLSRGNVGRRGPDDGRHDPTEPIQ